MLARDGGAIQLLDTQKYLQLQGACVIVVLVEVHLNIL